MKLEVVIAINPGSTSTKVGIFTRQESLAEYAVEHDVNEMLAFEKVTEQYDLRYQAVLAVLEQSMQDDFQVQAIVGRGGPLKPLTGGTYAINETMLDDLKSCRFADHPSNLGAIIAESISQQFSVPAYVVDPITVDEFAPVARISGVPGIIRMSRSHALNIKASARKAAKEMNHDYHDCNMVVAHLGGGFSIAAVQEGRIIDNNNGLLGQGPFSPNRAGALPISGVIDLCFAENATRAEIEKLLSKESGFLGYLGTADVQEVLNMIEQGDTTAQLIYDAMIYQVAKEIGAMSVALKAEKIDCIILTGGLTKGKQIVEDIISYVSFLAPIIVYPGENELEALARGAFRVIDGIEPAFEYL